MNSGYWSFLQLFQHPLRAASVRESPILSPFEANYQGYQICQQWVTICPLSSGYTGLD